MKNLAHQILVTIDGSVSYRAWTLGDTWNGFECPYFELPEALRVAENIPGFRFIGDQIIFPPCKELGDTKPSFTKHKVICTPKGPKKVWPIGAYGWTWMPVNNNEATKYSQTQP